MKALFKSFLFLIVIAAQYTSKANTLSPVSGTHTPSRMNLIYYWDLYADGCYHLTRINPPGHIDDTGNYYSGYSITVMTSSNFEGNSTICPIDTEGYC